jgi:hypothetical protein
MNRITGAGEFRWEEALAGGTITPGMLVALQSDGTVEVHADEGGYSERAFATENALVGETIDHDYASGENVFFALGAPGAEVYAFIQAGQTISIGEQLISAADGTLKAADDIDSGETLDQTIAVALEAIDLSDTSDVDTRIMVRLL